MTDTLITDGEQTEVADQQQATATEEQTAAPASGENPGGEQQATEQKPEEGKKETPPGAPEKYEFQAPDGTALDDAVVGAFSEVAKKHNLTQEQAQDILASVAPVIASRNAEAFSATVTGWAEETKADKEIGGAALNENLAIGKKALDAFGSDPLRTMLNDTGLGNHPEVIRFFVKVGKAISEDGFVAGGGGQQASNDPRNLYKASNMNP